MYIDVDAVDAVKEVLLSWFFDLCGWICNLTASALVKGLSLFLRECSWVDICSQ